MRRFRRFVIALSLLVVASVGCGDLLQTSSQTLDFGEVYVGTTAQQGPVTWTNDGSKPITTMGVTIQGGPVFSARPSKFQPKVVVDPKGQTPNVMIAFSPSVEQSYSGKATLQRRPIVRANQRDLKGAGKFQILKGALMLDGEFGSNLVAGQHLDFGTVLVSEGQTVTRRFLLVNAGRTNLQLTSSWSVGNQGFTVTNPPGPFTIRSFTQKWVTIEFLPPGAGTFTEAVTFQDPTGAHLAGTAVRGRGSMQTE
jgi:hypothetical protein